MAEINYAPRAEFRSEQSEIALCLSGGGFRSALFHMGALRRLNELAILSRVDTISSVSGGSVLSAYLLQQMQPWPEAGSVLPNWETQVAAPFRAFASKNLRTGPLLERWLRPWNWLNSGVAIAALARRFEKNLTSFRLSALPDRPRFVFCSTDMVFRVNWIFERDKVGDYQAGYATPTPDWPIARAVAASACFPPLFGPMPMRVIVPLLRGGRFPQGQERQKLLSGLRLTDGGVYDNLGLEPVWKNHQLLLVSDGGAPFTPDGSTNFFRQLKRYLDITGNQGSSLRKRWLISNFKDGPLQGSYWGIRSATANYGSSAPAGYPEELAEGVIAGVRTDFDAFSEAEISVLENHGYLLAEAAIKSHLSKFAQGTPVPLNVPHPGWMDPARVEGALVDSSKRTVLGRKRSP